MTKKDPGLPKNWPKNWPQSLEEFTRYLQTSDELRKYLEDRGIELRSDKGSDRVTIWKREKK